MGNGAAFSLGVGATQRSRRAPPVWLTSLELSPLIAGPLGDTLGAMSFSVLVVDDDESFRAMSARILQRRGFHVVGDASDGAGAVRAVEAMRPDGVLLDVHLPDANGFDVARTLARLEQPPRVLLTSSDAYVGDDKAAARCGAAGFVAKTDLPTAELDRYFPSA